MRIRHLCCHNLNSISICELEILLLFPNLDLILIWGRPRTPFCRQNRPQGQVKLPPLLGFIPTWFWWYSRYFWGILVVFGCISVIFGCIWEKSNCLDYSAPTLRIHFQLIELDFDPILKPVLRSFAYFNVSCQCCLCLTNMLCFFTRLLFSLLSFAL